MKNKSPNGHYPPGIPPGGKLLQLPESAAAALQQEMVQKLQPHLNELNQENAAHQSAISLVFAAAIRLHGVPALLSPALVTKDVDDGGLGPIVPGATLYDACLQLADKLAKQNLRSTHEKARELFVEKGIKPRDLPPHIVRAAGRQGVMLAEPEALSADVGTPAVES